VSVLGEEEPYAGRSDYAAKICQDAEVNGYDDWFLPSKDELNLIYENLHLKGAGGYSSGIYWSSSETHSRYAWGQDFYDGSQYGINRNFDYRVRPVRAF